MLNYPINNQEFFNFFKNLEMILLESKNLNPNTDDLKPFCRFLWDIYAGLHDDKVNDFDIIEKTIREM